MSNLEMERWKRDGDLFGWKMPTAPTWKRLPLIRHVRAIRAKFSIELWYAFGPGSIGIRSGFDDWVVFGIWHGMETC
jgi:hypothetical protein